MRIAQVAPRYVSELTAGESRPTQPAEPPSELGLAEDFTSCTYWCRDGFVLG